MIKTAACSAMLVRARVGTRGSGQLQRGRFLLILSHIKQILFLKKTSNELQLASEDS